MTETPGIVLDFSHGSAADLDFAIVWYAHRRGWDGGQNDVSTLTLDWDSFQIGEAPDDYDDGDEEDFLISYQEALTFACDDAVEWLNENIAGDDHHYYVIDDNSLYYWPTEV